jgi:NAD(P)-dependent dehydrogenase (short-subunit alcohol dehydrogenase family)
VGARETAIVFGVGPGLGWALAKHFVAENMRVGAVARDETKLDALIRSGVFRDVGTYAADVSKIDDIAPCLIASNATLENPILLCSMPAFSGMVMLSTLIQPTSRAAGGSVVTQGFSSGKRPHGVWRRGGVGRSYSRARPLRFAEVPASPT